VKFILKERKNLLHDVNHMLDVLTQHRETLVCSRKEKGEEAKDNKKERYKSSVSSKWM